MTDKILSISIASYNAEKDISRCLESMIDTSVIDLLDIIVVNDGSIDKTFEVASKYAVQFPNSIRVIDKKNGGHGSTINVGIVEAEGKYFKIVDSDDWVDKDGIESLVKFLSKTDVDLVVNPFHIRTLNNINRCSLTNLRPQNINANEILHADQLTGSENLYMHSMTFKTAILKKVGPVIDEHCFYVDMEYCIYPLIYVNSICFQDYSVYQYLLGSQTQSVSISNLIKRRNEHKRVILSLIKFYTNSIFINQNICAPIKKIIFKRICQAIEGQYWIYLRMGNKCAKIEMDEFSEIVKKYSFEREIYKESKLKHVFIKCLILSNNSIFELLSLLYKIERKLFRKFSDN